MSIFEEHKVPLPPYRKQKPLFDLEILEGLTLGEVDRLMGIFGLEEGKAPDRLADSQDGGKRPYLRHYLSVVAGWYYGVLKDQQPDPTGTLNPVEKTLVMSLLEEIRELLREPPSEAFLFLAGAGARAAQRRMVAVRNRPGDSSQAFEEIPAIRAALRYLEALAEERPENVWELAQIIPVEDPQASLKALRKFIRDGTATLVWKRQEGRGGRLVADATWEALAALFELPVIGRRKLRLKGLVEEYFRAWGIEGVARKGLQAYRKRPD